MVILLFVVLFLFLLLTALTLLQWFNIVLPLALLVICATIIFLFLWLYEVYRVIIKGYAPYVRSSKRIIARILQEIDFKDGAIVYDLGCGDGRFLRELVQRKNVKAFGYEYFSVPYLLAQTYNLLAKKKIKFYYRDFFKANLADADYVFCYLITKEMAPLEEKLKKELKPGAVVIANTFQFKNWQPEKNIILNENKRTALSNKLFFYRQK